MQSNSSGEAGGSIVGELLDYLNESWTQFHATGIFLYLLSSNVVVFATSLVLLFCTRQIRSSSADKYLSR